MMFVTGLILVAIAVVFGFLYRSARSQKRNEYDFPMATFAKIAGVVAAVLGLSVALLSFITIVPAGHVGVVDVFGNVRAEVLKPGLNVVNPFARIIPMSTQTQEDKETMPVPSKEGLTVDLEASVLYKLDPEKAAAIYKTVGAEYQAVILQPQFRSVIRDVTARFEAKALYTSGREEIEQAVIKQLGELVRPRGVIIETVPMRKLTLPQNLSASIEEKLKAEQDSQRMEFILTKEKQEADRKRIEARGIADFQEIVTKGISEPLLKWKGIEATEALAKSQNTKIVIIGAGKDGLPLILGGDAAK